MTPANALPSPQPDWAWFLDFDGTLVDIADTPDGVRVPADLRDVLRKLSAAAGGALAIVTGRTVGGLSGILHPLLLPIAGLHGLERVDADGRLFRPAINASALDAIRPPLARYAASHPGLLLEDKKLTLALHYRAAPELADDAARAVAAAVGDAAGLCVLHGKMVLEVKPVGHDKGGAVRAFLAEPPFTGRVPVYVGDDTTDEDGFRAANAMGGVSVLVGPNRPTEARFRIASPAALRAYLKQAGS